MITSTPHGIFVQLAGEAYPRGPFQSRDRAARVIANAAAKAERAAAPKGRRSPGEPIEPRVVKGHFSPSRRSKRTRKGDQRRVLRSLRRAKVRDERVAKAAQDRAAAASVTGGGDGQ